MESILGRCRPGVHNSPVTRSVMRLITQVPRPAARPGRSPVIELVGSFRRGRIFPDIAADILRAGVQPEPRTRGALRLVSLFDGIGGRASPPAGGFNLPPLAMGRITRVLPEFFNDGACRRHVSHALITGAIQRFWHPWIVSPPCSWHIADCSALGRSQPLN